MEPWEIMISESQERMLAIVTDEQLADVREVCDRWDLDCTVIGEVTDSKMLRIYWHGERVADIPARRLADESPVIRTPSVKPGYLVDEPVAVTTRPTRRRPTWARRSRSCSPRPTSPASAGPASSTTTSCRPTPCRSPAATPRCCASRAPQRGIAFSNDCNGRHCYLDPYRGAKAAIAEAARNLACAGALPVAVTDCLNFGNPEKGEIYWQFEQAVEGIAEACEALDTPVVSGNVSFYNESFGQAIYPTPMIGMLGVYDDVSIHIDDAFKDEGDVIVLLGAGRRLDGRLRVPEGRLRQGRGPHARRGPGARGRAAGQRCARPSRRACSRAPTTAPRAASPWRWPSAHRQRRQRRRAASPTPRRRPAGGRWRGADVGARLRRGRRRRRRPARPRPLRRGADARRRHRARPTASPRSTRCSATCRTASLGRVTGADLRCTMDGERALRRPGERAPRRLRVAPASGSPEQTRTVTTIASTTAVASSASTRRGSDVARLTFFGLYALQHRGQESAGIAVTDDGQITVIKDLGLVRQVFNEQMLTSLSGQHAIGHVRYSTTGSSHWQNSQPLVRSRNGDVIALGHNGNLVNTTRAARRAARARACKFAGTTDTEVITALIAHEAEGDLLGAVRTAVSQDPRRLLGGRALAATPWSASATRTACARSASATTRATPSSAARPPASTSSAPSFVREIEPGEIVIADERARPAQRARRARGRAAGALHLRVHLLRPARQRHGRQHAARWRARRWAGTWPLEAPVEADLVIPVPDTGMPAAIGYAARLRHPLRRGPHQEPLRAPHLHPARRASCARSASA